VELHFGKALRTPFKGIFCSAENLFFVLHFSMNKWHSSFRTDPILFPSPSSSPRFFRLTTVSKNELLTQLLREEIIPAVKI